MVKIPIHPRNTVHGSLYRVRQVLVSTREYWWTPKPILASDEYTQYLFYTLLFRYPRLFQKKVWAYQPVYELWQQYLQTRWKNLHCFLTRVILK